MKMKLIRLFAAGCILCLLPNVLRAAGPDTGYFTFDPSSALFSANELSLDVFGYHATRDKGGGRHDAWGPGAAFNYFVNEYVGVGAETYADAFEAPYLLNVLGTVRYPIHSISLAPYAILGVGRQWDHAAQWLGHFGAGVEYRFNAKTGTFVDVRRVFAANSPDYTLVRFGFRLTF